MATLNSSFTSSSEPAGTGPGSRLASTLAWAVGAIVALNAFVGFRLTALLLDSPVNQVLDLDARVARFGAPEKVKVLLFGNSHAQHMLRPPSLGPALGLAEDEVFSLALPGATAYEMGLLAQRYATRFPAARRAIVGVDEVLLTLLPWFNDTRIRYLTRFDPAARWRYAGYYPDLERRTGALAWLPMPLADFCPAIRDALRQEPRRLAGRLAWGEAGRASGPPKKQTPYPWGFPPKADIPPDSAAGRAHFRTMRRVGWLRYRAGVFYGAPEAIGRSLEDLETTCRALEARGIEVRLVAPLFTRTMRYHLAHERANEKRRFDAALADYQRASGRSLVSPTIEPSEVAFVDADHLSTAGARMYAEDVIRRLRWTHD